MSAKKKKFDLYPSEDLLELEAEEREDQEKELSIDPIPAEPEPIKVQELRADFISTRDVDKALKIIEERDSKGEEENV